jgi:protein-L-isoaspartate(D-aspartate) O-methyltransferase
MDLEAEKRRLYDELKKSGIEESIIEALLRVKRELFVPDHLAAEAYSNIPLPVGSGQTISQPFTVAFMVQLLDLKKDSKVLEIGAGSGYNAATMSVLAPEGKIVSIEIKEELAEKARTNIKQAGIQNVKVVVGDGADGWPKDAPYDRIIATCGVGKIPDAWHRQLRPGGIMVVPVNNGSGTETMVKITDEGISHHGDFTFVPMTGKLQ